MTIGTFKVSEGIPAWKTVLDITERLDCESWLLVGGLMTQVHAGLAGYSSRATTDADILVDMISRAGNLSATISVLKELGFEPKEPGLRGSAFHRLENEGQIVDVLVADHLPASRKKAARVNTWSMLETPGGAQAIERKVQVKVVSEHRAAIIYVPNLLGALVLKAAAYTADRRNSQRHLDDVALLAGLITDHRSTIEQLHGSDRKRIRRVAEALADPSALSWQLLDEDMRVKGQDTLRILSEA